jgi:PKD repeat protein
MTTNLHIVRRALICLFLLIVLTAEVTNPGAVAYAQNYVTGSASAPLPSPTGNAMSLGAYGAASPPVGASNSIQAPPIASLLDVPAYGTAPLTVDFYVGLASPHGPLVYQWNFGDGAVSLMPAGAYMLHVYQHPRTYLCSLNLTTAQGKSTLVFTTITVKPHQG